MQMRFDAYNAFCVKKCQGLLLCIREGACNWDRKMAMPFDMLKFYVYKNVLFCLMIMYKGRLLGIVRWGCLLTR